MSTDDVAELARRIGAAVLDLDFVDRTAGVVEAIAARVITEWLNEREVANAD